MSDWLLIAVSLATLYGFWQVLHLVFHLIDRAHSRKAERRRGGVKPERGSVT